MESDYTEYMFKIPIVHVSVKDWNQKKNVLLGMIGSSKMRKLNEENVSSDYYNQTNNPLYNIQIAQLFKEELDIFCNELKFSQYKIVMSWFQTSSKGDYHGIHTHGLVGYSAVCFIDYDDNEHTPTQFISPFNNLLTGSALLYSPTVKEGSLIFFPACILHYTEPNTSTKERKILSFNINVS
jgi:hypothetical protein